MSLLAAACARVPRATLGFTPTASGGAAAVEAELGLAQALVTYAALCPRARARSPLSMDR